MFISLNIWLGAIGLVIIASVLGCFIVWRRMGYFGDALAHSALLGIALGLLVQGSTSFGWEHQLGILAVALLFALLFVQLMGRQLLSPDILLGILSHTALALGLLSIAFLGTAGGEGHGHEEFDFHDILLGNPAQIGTAEIALIYAAAVITLLLLYWNRKALLLITLSEDLAKVQKIPVARLNFLLMALMAVFVVSAAQQIGILLIGSLLIIPAATARQFASNPQAMIGWSLFFGITATTLGLSLSHATHMPQSASIVSVLAAIFFFLLLIKKSP